MPYGSTWERAINCKSSGLKVTFGSPHLVDNVVVLAPLVRPSGAARPDSAERARVRQRFEQMRPAMQRLRDQAQADRRDAIAVLTPDQQARAWERVAASGRMRRGGMDRGFKHGHSMHGSRMGMREPGRTGPRYNADRRGPTPQRRPDDQQ
jgi:hypothetical protein